MEKFTEYENCTLCPRNCHAKRNEGNTGVCGMTSELLVSRAALHMWEEPIVSGKEGSGTVFFSGCNLHCVYCQNHEISGTEPLKSECFKTLKASSLSDVFLRLQNLGANNINLVTGTHYIPHIAKAIEISKNSGLSIPVLYNTSGYESVESLKLLEGLVDIYLPDFKYWKESNAGLYSNAGNYCDIAKEAIKEMFRQTGSFAINEKTGLIEKGLIVRHLVLPGATNEAISILDYLYTTYKDDIFISIMNQYTPFLQFLPIDSAFDNLRRKVTRREYEKVVNHAIDMGIENCFIQDREAISESFIPSFRCEGL